MNNFFLDHLDHIQTKALETLELNRIKTPKQKFTYHQPSTQQYHHRQWLWDSCFHAIAYRHHDPEIAASEICALLEHQFLIGPNQGMIPHMRFWEESLGRTTAFNYNDRSWITNPPLIASSALLVAEKIKNPIAKKSFLEKVYFSVVKFHDWFDRCRTFNDSPLVVNVHPWETGRDAAIAWDQALPVPESFSKDIEQLFIEKSDQTLSEFLEEQKALYALERSDGIFSYKDQRHQSRCLLNNLINLVDGNINLLRDTFGSFCVYAVDFNAIRANDLQSLSEIARLLNLKSEIVNAWDNKAEAVRIAIRETLWNPMNQTFQDRQLLPFGDFKWLPQSAACFIAFFGSVPSSQQASILIDQMLVPAKYRRKYLIPSEPADSIAYQPNIYWRGNVWPSVQWLIWRGLLTYEEKLSTPKSYLTEARKKLASSIVQLVSEQGIFEYYNPETGAGLGESNQSWTAVVLDILLSEASNQRHASSPRGS